MLSVDRPSTECRPITDRYIGQVSTNYRRSVGEKSAKCRWTKSYISRDTSGTTIDRVSTECRATIDRLSTALSTDCRPSIDRLSTESRPLYRPLCRPISRSTLPTVNKIHYYYHLSLDHLRNYCFMYSNCKLPGFLSNSRIMKTMILLISMGSLHLNTQLIGN